MSDQTDEQPVDGLPEGMDPKLAVEVLPHRVTCPHCQKLMAAMVLNNRKRGVSVMYTHADASGQPLVEALKSGELVEAMMKQIGEEVGDAIPEGAPGVGAG